jgi:hypothetical protein
MKREKEKSVRKRAIAKFLDAAHLGTTGECQCLSS